VTVREQLTNSECWYVTQLIFGLPGGSKAENELIADIINQKLLTVNVHNYS